MKFLEPLRWTPLEDGDSLVRTEGHWTRCRVNSLCTGYSRIPKNKRGKKKQGKRNDKVYRNIAQFRARITCRIYNINTGATTGQGHSFFFNYPSYYRSQTGTVTQMQDVPTVLANEQKVFDEYKVHSMTLQYVPNFTQNQVATTNLTDNWMVSLQDNDSSGILTSNALAMNTQDRKIHSTIRGWTRVMKPNTEDAGKWLNLTAIIPNNTSPPDPNNPSKLATIKVWTPGYTLANLAYGHFFCTWDVSFRGSFNI